MKIATFALRTAMSGALLALALSAPRAHAQGAGSAAAAEALFAEGRRLMEEGKLDEACPKLAASNRLDPGAGTLLNLAACYEKNGQTASAWASYREAASEARKSARTQWEEQARARAAALEPGLSRLTIKVPPQSNVNGLVVERDGIVVEQAQWDIAIPVDPGLHPVTATAPRKQQWATSVTVGPNAASVVVTIPALVLEQGAEPVAPPLPVDRQPGPEPTDSPRSTSSQKTIGMVLTGVGVVGLGVGTYFGLAARSSHDDAMAECDTQLQCSPRGIDLDDQARSEATASTIAVGAGIAFLAGGLSLWLTAPESSSTASTARSIRVGLAPTPTGGALSMSGAW